MSVQNHLAIVFQAFIDAHFTKRQLYEMCRKKGIEPKDRKDALIIEVIRLCSPEELLEANKIIQRLRWYERLILSLLLSGSKTVKEIVEHELVQRIFSQGIPEVAFGIVTSKTLNREEASKYLCRKVSGLKKKHLIIMKKKGRKGVYSIHPWFLPYFKKKLASLNEKEIIKQIRHEAANTMRFFLKQFPPRIVWNSWKDCLNNFERLITELRERMEKGESNLRFNVPAVKVSEIADQYYCEKKVELTRRYGRKATPEMLLGKEAHEKLLEGTIKIKREKLWKQIAHGLPVMVREMPLLGKYKDVIIMGIADGVYFEEGVPKLLLEYKFTKSLRPWHDYHVQARIYCFLLHLIGFNTKRLKYALILAPPQCRMKEELKKKIVDIIIRNLEKDFFEEKIDGTILKIYAADFQINYVRKELDWALDFWRKKREAIPTKKAGKCNVCEFKKLCHPSSG